MKVDLELTPHEIGLILLWSEKTVSGGHWGDGNTLFTDEAVVMQKLKDVRNGEHHDFTMRDVEIMLIWMEGHSAGGLHASHNFSAEEEQLSRKLIALKGTI